MAITAREVLLTFRAQNYMSGAIRRIGADVGGLSRTAQLANQRAQLNINQQRLMRTRSIAQTELGSIDSGTRSLAIQKARLALSREEFNNAQNLRRNYEAQLSNQSALLKNQNTQTMLQRRMAGQSLMKGEFGGMNQAELQQAYKAALIDQNRLLSSSATLRRQEEMLTGTMNSQSLAAQKVAASETEMYQRQAQLVQQINTTNEALTLNTEKLRQNALAMQQLKFESFANGAAKVEHAGRAIQMFGIIAGAAMGYAADAAANFGTSMTLAATQSTTATDNSTKNIVANAGVLQNAVTRLLASGRTAAQPSDLTNSLYQIFSGLTFKGNQASQLRQGINLLKEFNDVYTANYGQVQFNDIVSAGINLINNFGLRASQLPRVLNTMQASVRFGAIGMGQFVGSLSQVVPAYRAAHYSFTQLAQDVAFVSRLFPQSIRTGTTGLARLTEMFARPTVISGIKSQFGVNIAPGGQLLPLNRIITQIEKARPGIFATSLAIGNFFKQVGGTQGTIQARRVLAGYVGEMQLYRTVAGQVANDNNELSRSIRAMRETPGFKWNAFKDQMRAVVLELGAGAIPAFRAFAKPIEAAIRWFDQLNPRTQKFIGYTIAMTGIVAALGGTLAAVGGGLARWGAILSGSFLAKAGGEAGFINLRYVALLGTVGLLILAFTKFHAQTEAVINAFGGLKNTIAVVISLFAAWKLAGYVIMFSRLAVETAGLATSITEVGTAAKIATLETIGLRTALMGIAGLVITATILIVSRKQVSAAGRNLLGDEINKEIDAVTAQPSPLSFGQKLGNWLFESPTTATKNLFKSFLPGQGWDAGWKLAVEQQKSGIGRIAVAYKAFLTSLGRPLGTPAALKQFLALFQQHGLGKASSSTDIEQFIQNVQRASYGAKNVRNLDDQMKLLRKDMFQLARQDPFADINNRAALAAAKTRGLRADLKDIVKVNQQIGKSAVQMGVVSTPAFKQLFENLVEAKVALKGHEGNVRLQRNVINAQQSLQANVSKQQAAAAQRAATAQANAANQVAPAWQTATQSGIVATAQYVKLYNAVNRAQAAMTKDPTLANQRAYLKATAALQTYVNNATAANQQIAANATTTYQDVVNNIQQMYDSLLQQNQTNFGTLFQGPFINSPAMQNFTQWGGKLTGRDLTKDLQSQVRQFRNFNSLLTSLARRGAPAELIAQLRALGPQAIQQIRALSQMSKPELDKYFNVFRNAQRMIHRQTMRDLNRQLKDYLKYGRNIGAAMAAGIRQESPAITKAIQAMVRRAFPQLGHGLVPAGAGAGAGGGTHHHTHHHQHHTQHDHTHIHSGGQDADTKARHAAFRNRNRHRRNRFHGDRYGG